MQTAVLNNIKNLNSKAFQFNCAHLPITESFVADFFSNSIITGIWYGKFLPDNQHLFLSNNIDMARFSYMDLPDNGYFNDIVKQIPLDKTHTFLWSSDIDHAHIQQYKTYNVCNGFCFYIRQGAALHAIQFTTDSDVDFMTVSNYYLSNKEGLEKVGLHLINKFQSLVSSNSNVPMAVFAEPVDISYKGSANLELTSQNNPALINLYRKYRVGGKEITLTEKQNECLKLVASGLTAKKIAQLLEVSSRTVESNIEVIKSKMNCTYKSDLIDIYHQNKY